MLLNIIVVCLMILVTLYLAKQGTLTAILTLITASFGSFLAMAYFEGVGSMLQGWRPDYARGASFLILYLLGFGAVRLAADLAVPKGVKLPGIADRVTGGVVGFFAALVILGNLVIGLEMLPLGTKILGFDRFGGEGRMTRDGMGRVKGGSSIWFGPEHFVTGMWSLASGGAMGGGTAFADVHPDILAESYGYRNTVEPGANPSLLPEFGALRGTYEITDPKQVKAFPVGEGDMKIEVVRVQTEQGGQPPKRAADADPYFRITPTQVRMVASKGGDSKQYYPIGYMENGTKFVSTPLDTGHLVDDFQTDDAVKKELAKGQIPGLDPGKLSIVHDWVFAIPADEKPEFVEIKQHTRLPIPAKPAGAEVAQINPIFYPPRLYRQNPAILTVKVSAVNAYDKNLKPLAKADVWILRPVVEQRLVKEIAGAARGKIERIRADYSTSSNGWGEVAAKENNLPQSHEFRMQEDRVRDDIMLKSFNDQISWGILTQICLYSEMTPRPTQSVDIVNRYFENTLVKLYQDTGAIIEKTGTGADGQVQVKIAKGGYVAIIRAKTPDGLYFWFKSFSGADNEKVLVDVNTGVPDFKIELKKN